MFLIAALTLGISGPIPIIDLVPTASLPSHESEHSIVLDVDRIDARQRAADVRKMLNDVNSARRAAGVAPLDLDPRLERVAVDHASDMIAHRFFGHDSSNGQSCFDRLTHAGIGYESAGENIALDVDEKSANRELERSNEHRENILDPAYRHVGIAAMRAQDGSEIFVQDFTN